jgi:alpha-methylacyl-CoA racemase
MPGPLAGTRIIELAGIGPGPFAAMLLSDMGAEVIRVERAGSAGGGGFGSSDVTMRNRRSIMVDLKQPEGLETVLRLVEQSDALIEGYRPGVTERLGLGPDVCLERNPKLVYGRMTGWGQDGPYAPWAGHDLNYISLAGAAAHIGRADQPPTPPLNLVGDYGGGAMFLAYGIVCSLFEATRSGQGQVVDAAMVDGAALLMAPFWSSVPKGGPGPRGTGLLDSGAHFYDAYRCSDGEYVSIGSIEPQFYAELLRITGLTDDPDFVGAHHFDSSTWEKRKARLTEIFATKTRDEWCALMEHTDVCFAPVLTMSEALQHPHNIARGTFVEIDGQPQPGPAPRLSRTPGEVTRSPIAPGTDTRAVLADAGFDAAEIEALETSGAVQQA